MKRKLSIFILAIVCALTGAAYLTACSGSEPEKTLTGISCEVNHANFTDGAFNFEYGDTVEIAKSSFTVTARYSDGSEKAVTDFNVETSVPSGTVALGSYSVTVSYGKAQPVIYAVNVNARNMDSALKAFLDGITVDDTEYTGGEINVIDKIAGLRGYLEASDGCIETSGTVSATEIGDYTFTVQSKQGYEPYSKTVLWRIVAAQPKVTQISAPTLKSATAEYDGQEHGVELIFAQDTPQAAIDCISVSSEGTPDKKYVNAGEYYYEVTINGDAYIFAGDQTSVTLAFTITKKALSQNRSDIAVTPPVYKTSPITLDDIGHNVDTERFTVTLDYVNENAGDPGQISFAPKENVALNYCWKDGSDIEETGYYETFVVVKAPCPDYTDKADEILQNAVKEYTYSDDYTFARAVDELEFTQSAKEWLAANLGHSDYAEIEIATGDIPSGGSAVTRADGTHFAASEFGAGEFSVWADYTPDSRNYEGTARIQIKVSVAKADLPVNVKWSIGNGEAVPVKDSYYYISLDLSSDATFTDYYKAKKTDEYTEMEKGSHGYTEFTSVGYYKSVALYSVNLDNYDVTVWDEYNGVYSEVAGGIEFVSEWQIYNPSPQGRTFAFAELKILKTDGSEPAAEEIEQLGDIAFMVGNLNSANSGTSIRFENSLEMSGTCTVYESTFDEMKENGAPAYYGYSPSTSKEKPVEVFQKENGEKLQDSVIAGSIVGDTLTLSMEIAGDGIPAGFAFVFTFTAVEK